MPKAIDELPVMPLLCTQAVGTSTIKDAGFKSKKKRMRLIQRLICLNLLGFKPNQLIDGLIL